MLLPGITANLHNFDGLIDAGLAPRFRVVGLDLRGPLIVSLAAVACSVLLA